jgi:transposase-like protein
MVEHIQQIISEYQQRIVEMPYMPKRPYGHMALGINVGVNMVFFTFLFSDKDLGIQFLKDVGLFHSKVPCNTCGRDMTWCADPTTTDGFRWRCRRKVAEAKCSPSKAIRHGSWFQQSKLTFQEVLYLKYDIVRHVAAHLIQQEYGFSSKTIGDWGMFRRETMLVYMEGCSEKIGGSNKTVEIDESTFGRRKYNRGHPVTGQWVFGGVKRESGRTFLVPVPDRTADTLMIVTEAWIEPGTTVISDCWSAYRDLDPQGYTHRTVNHTISFVNEDGDHTNTIQSMWRHVKAYLKSYKRRDDVSFFPTGLRATFRHLRAERQYRFGSCSECCAVIRILFHILTNLYIYNTYGGYTCYFCNSNVRTAPQFQAVRLFHDVRSRSAGRQQCF